jgi:hypothetical protein
MTKQELTTQFFDFFILLNQCSCLSQLNQYEIFCFNIQSISELYQIIITALQVKLFFQLSFDHIKVSFLTKRR